MKRRTGFTLIEMLVATALVLLLMMLFASVFQIATGAMVKQKGIAENDQKARILTTVLRSDLLKRTYRDVVASEPKTAIPTQDVAARQGYFYISENDRFDDTDDVLQFTVATSIIEKDKDQSPLYGRAVPLIREGTSQSVTDYVLNNPNQPEIDDGQVNLNSAGLSTVGEVAYFLRNGILYRRMMLVRTPFVGQDATPTGFDDNGVNEADLITDPYVPDPLPGYLTGTGASGVFWRDFDYSAVNTRAIDVNNPNRPVFVGAGGAGYLSNAYTTALPQTHVPSLGMPNVRWGFDTRLAPGVAGRSREYAAQVADAAGNVTARPRFIGRFTQAETSHEAFLYPGTYDPATYPFSRTLTLTAAGTVQEYDHGPRRGEDIMLTNVHAFDVKVFDSELMQFVDLGGDSGEYARARCLNPNYGPRADDPSKNNVFDTWHPDFDTDGDPDTLEQPPYRPVNADGTPRRMRAIQVTLRYVDVTTQQMRNLTLQVGLTE